MTTDDLLMRRLERANPCPVEPEAARSAWGRGLLSAITDRGDAPAPVSRPRRRIGRRGALLAVAAALCLAAGGALATMTLRHEASPGTKAQIREALDLPSPERGALRPVRGGIAEALRAETPYGTWVIDTVTTKGRGVLINTGALQPDGTVGGRGMGSTLAGCPERILAANGVIGWCTTGAGHRSGSAADDSLYEIVGRVAPQVASVELTTAQGQAIPAYVGGGFWLILTSEDLLGRGLTVTARDAAGERLADLSLDAVGGAPDLVVARPAGSP